jgi:hypothetical protein
VGEQASPQVLLKLLVTIDRETQKTLRFVAICRVLGVFQVSCTDMDAMRALSWHAVVRLA